MQVLPLTLPLHSPKDICLTHDQTSLLICDTYAHRILSHDLDTNETVVLAGCYCGNRDFEDPLFAMFRYPESICAASNGDVFVADTGNGSIRRIDGETGYVSTVANELLQPRGISCDEDGVVYFCESGHHRVRSVDQDGFIEGLAGVSRGDMDGKGIQAKFNVPTGLCLAGDNRIYLSDTGNRKVRVLDENRVSRVIGDRHVVGTPRGIVWDEERDVVFVSDLDKGRVVRIDGEGKSKVVCDGMRYPHGLLVKDGRLYVCDSLNQRIVVYSLE
eukprot:TRINITY_DN9789_c0_g1_i1.p1 TRINITY_DN9789_c0_g1~~TRINITY_DN9789_c0_g1_i1.p1  ORF type:complete len:273 (+),score=50.42 TRINITY_DN9789_c0_g1_i1:144-962(+)